jgi:hypothetical protein
MESNAQLRVNSRNGAAYPTPSARFRIGAFPLAALASLQVFFNIPRCSAVAPTTPVSGGGPRRPVAARAPKCPVSPPLLGTVTTLCLLGCRFQLELEGSKKFFSFAAEGSFPGLLCVEVHGAGRPSEFFLDRVTRACAFTGRPVPVRHIRHPSSSAAGWGGLCVAHAPQQKDSLREDAQPRVASEDHYWRVETRSRAQDNQVTLDALF